MPTLTLKAHFDGEQIRLDEPFDLPDGCELMVTILPNDNTDRAVWAVLSGKSLARAYSDDEPEYSAEDIVS